MVTVGLDLHKRDSQLCIGREDGTIEERRNPQRSRSRLMLAYYGFGVDRASSEVQDLVQTGLTPL